MNREDDFSISDLRRKREQQSQPAAPQPQIGGDLGGSPPKSANPTPYTHPILKPIRSSDDDEDDEGGFPVDFWRMAGALQRQWKWLLAATVLLGLLGFGAGSYLGRYAVAVKLIWRDANSSSSEAFKVEPITQETMLSYIRSWDIARRIEAKAQPPISAAKLMANILIQMEPKSDIVVITIQGKDTNDMVNLANLYAAETVAFTKEFQLLKPRETIRDNEEREAKLDKDIRLAEAEMAAFRKANGVVDPKAEQEVITKQLADLITLIRIKKWDQEHSELKLLTDRLSVWKKKLFDDRATYTDQNPIVISDLAEIARLELQISNRNQSAKSPGVAPAPPNLSPLAEDEIASLERDRVDLIKELDGLPEKVRQHVVLKANLDAMDELRSSIEKILLAARQYEKNAEGYFRISRPVTSVDVDTRPRMKKAKGFALKGAMAGLFMAAALVLLMELKDRTMKTAAEVERVTGLRVAASLADLNKMTTRERENWAFRAWTVIAGQLNTSASHGMVCGFISSGAGEGRSTWIKLLGEAATRRGLRVLTVATKPSGTDEAGAEAETAVNEKSFTEAVEEAMSERQSGGAEQLEVEPAPSQSQELAPASAFPANYEFVTLNASVLAFPAEVSQRFNSGDLPAAHIPLPGWVWNLERRRQWQMALAHWRMIDNLVLLVELPPACLPESVLLAECLPQLIWLADSGKARISETKEQLEMMRHAKCHIVCAVLNHEPDPIIKL